MMPVVLPTVLELLLDTSTDLHAQVLDDGQVPVVKKRVKVFAQQDPVRDEMWARVSVRPNMSSLQDRKRALARDRAAPRIRLGDEDTECALSQPCASEILSTESRFGRPGPGGCLEP